MGEELNMRWKRVPPPTPGDHRTITRFVLWPVPCLEGHWHWLEIVTLNQYVDAWRDWEPCKKLRSGGRPVYNCPDKKEQA